MWLNGFPDGSVSPSLTGAFICSYSFKNVLDYMFCVCLAFSSYDYVLFFKHLKASVAAIRTLSIF